MWNKIIGGLAVAAVAAVAISYSVLFARINVKDAEIARLELRLSECGERVKDADGAIERQNAAIEAVRVDTVTVVKEVTGIARRYAETREIIVERIKNDSASDTKLFIIDSVLRCYHGM